MSVDAIVLAGGASRRFGSDKLAAELDGRPLLDRALEACDAVADRLVLVIAPSAPVPRTPSGLADHLVVVRDTASHQGPLAGLAAGLEAVTEAQVTLVVGGDMPSMDPRVLRLLVEQLAAAPPAAAAVLEADPPAPLPMAVRSTVARPRALSLLGEHRRSLRALLDELRPVAVPASAWRALDPEARTLADVDTEADLEALRSGLTEEAPQPGR